MDEGVPLSLHKYNSIRPLLNFFTPVVGDNFNAASSSHSYTIFKMNTASLEASSQDLWLITIDLVDFICLPITKKIA